MRFTEPLKQLADLDVKTNAGDAKNQRRLTEAEASLRSLIEVVAVKEYGYEELPSSLLESWELT